MNEITNASRHYDGRITGGLSARGESGENQRNRDGLAHPSGVVHERHSFLGPRRHRGWSTMRATTES